MGTADAGIFHRGPNGSDPEREQPEFSHKCNSLMKTKLVCNIHNLAGVLVRFNIIFVVVASIETFCSSVSLEL